MPLRARRRRLRALIALAILLFSGGAVWTVSLVSYLPRFSIQNISVSGAQKLSPRLIGSYAGTILQDGSYHLLSRSNIFLYPRESIEKGIVDTFARIKSARVSRSSLLATEVKIEVKEREPYALWCSDGVRCFTMDEDGFIFTEMSTATTTQYVFQGGLATSSEPIGQTFIKAHLPGLLTLLRFLGQAGYEPRGAVVGDEQDFSVSLARGFTIRASFGGDVSALTKNLQLVLSSKTLKGKEDQIEYIDLRFGNRVYYKLKGQVESSSN